MVSAEVHLIGGDTELVGVLRRTATGTGDRYWIRQGFGNVLIFTGLDIELLVGKRIVTSGKRARTRGHGRSMDAIWVTVQPVLADAR